MVFTVPSLKSINGQGVIQMAFQEQYQQQIEFSMERPLLLDLQYILNKLADRAHLTPTDVTVLDRCHSAPQSSELANTVNQIYLLIAESPIEQFFIYFEAIVSQTDNQSTLKLVLAMLNNRIRKDWNRFDQCYRGGLKEYTVKEIRKRLDEGEGGVLPLLNRTLVGMLRFQWDSLFKDFVSNMEATCTHISLNELLNNLSIVRLLLEEGFNTLEEGVSPYEFQRFRESIDQDMRIVLKMLCHCLQSEGPDRPAKVKKCLAVLRLAVDHISAFELFNCNIIEMLVGMIGHEEFRKPLIDCFQEIFRFKEVNTPNNSHSKIAHKLLLILETYLAEFEGARRIEYFEEKETVSTEDSFQSRRTRKKKEIRVDYRDLLKLLYDFLTRYVPFMDKSRSNEDLEIEYETNIKLYFSQDLYDSFRAIYWKLIQFVMHMASRFDALVYDDNDEDSVEQKRRVVCCLRLMLAMHSKLKLEVKGQLNTIIQLCILTFTPIQPEFESLYSNFGILKNGAAPITQKPPCFFELQEEYIEFIRTVLTESSTCKLFLSLIEQNIENYQQGQSLQKEKKKMPSEMISSKSYDEYQTLMIINAINRMCWSFVYAYRCNPQAIKKLSVRRLFDCLVMFTKVHRNCEVQRCYSVNSKYILQAYYPEEHMNEALISTLRTNKNQNIIEYVLVILSKILVCQHAWSSFALEDLRVMIGKLHEMEQLDIERERIIRLYPAIVYVLLKKTDQSEKSKKMKQIFEEMVFKEINNLKQFSSLKETRNRPELMQSVYLFSRLQHISKIVVEEYKSGKITHNGPIILKWTRSLTQKTIYQFQFKNEVFGNYLKSTERQNFDIQHMLDFRSHYIQLNRCFILLTQVVVEQEHDNHSPRVLQDAKLLFSMEQKNRNDFLSQTQFKQKQYFGFAQEFYRWAIMSETQACEELINASISAWNECLHGWEGDSQIQRGKYILWKEVVKMFGLRLNKMNREYLVKLYSDFGQRITLSGSIELILEVYEQLMIILSKQFGKGTKPLDFPEFTNFFITTFQTFFNSIAKQGPIFDRLGRLFYSQIDFYSCICPLDLKSKRDNNEIAFLIIKSHICQHLPLLESHEEHHLKLAKVFRERMLARWLMEMKDYVVFVSNFNQTVTSS